MPIYAGRHSTLARFAGRCLAAVLALLLVGCAPNVSDNDLQDISLTALQKAMDKNASSKNKDLLLLVDARSPKDFAEGHLPDARNMQLTAIPDKRGPLDRNLERYGSIVVYGNDRGSASARALAKRMLGVGYSNVMVFLGGVEEWRRANLPLVGAKQEP